MKRGKGLGLGLGLLGVAGLLAFSAIAGGLGQSGGAVRAKQADYTRVMTYNIQWFHARAGDQRVANIRAILDKVQPDIVGVQEVEGRAAMGRLFGSEWQVGMLDDPGEFQELGIAVRRPYRLESFGMLFTGEALNYAFPGKRDALRAVVRTPGGETLVVYVLHQKSRSGGRLQTDAQREMAAGLLAGYIAAAREENVVVMGDLNDAPNDRSVNILESGDLMAEGGPRGEYRILANATEELHEQDWTTLGVNDLFFGEPGVSARVRGAKADNDRLRGRDYRFPQDVQVRQVFFDQILVSPRLWARGVSAQVFDGVEALRGLRGRVRVSEDERTGARTVQYLEEGTLASDHLPVWADVRLR